MNFKKYKRGTIQTMRYIAIKAAKEAGKLLMKSIKDVQVTGTQYASKLCLKTRQDEESELLIVKIIKEKFPNHSFLGEEVTDEKSDSKYKWIIDPIDGTNNYLDGRDSFSVSIGLEYKGEVILGVVYLPKRDELFVAEKGKGATLNGKIIKVGNKKELLNSVITFSTFSGFEKQTKYLYKRLVENIPKLKYFGFEKDADIDPVFGRGSMAAEFCYLACGRIDGLIRLKQKPWDVAGGNIIASEAGAKMLNLKGKNCSIYEGDYIAANPTLLNNIMKIIQNK